MEWDLVMKFFMKRRLMKPISLALEVELKNGQVVKFLRKNEMFFETFLRFLLILTTCL